MNTRGLTTGYYVLLLAFVVLLVYYPTLFAPFNSLDDEVFVNYLLNLNGFSISRHFLPAGSPEYYRPLLTLSFEIDRYIGGLQEQFMHLFNVLIHTANVIIIFFLARKFSYFLGRKGDIIPFLCSALFAVHPLNTEAVNWIAGRTDLLAGLGVFSALLLFLHSLSSRKLFWGGLGMLFLLAGSLCKETALFLIPGLFLILVWQPVKSAPQWPRRRVLALMLAATMVGYVLLRQFGLRYDRGIAQTVEAVSDIALGKGAVDVSAVPSLLAFSKLPDASLALCKTIGFYAVKLLQPLPLNFAIHRIPNIYWVPGLLVISLIIYGLLTRRPRGVFFVLSMGIASSALLALFSGVSWTPVAERYMYIPNGPFAISILFTGAIQFERMHVRNIPGLAMVLILFLFAGASIQRNFVWQDNLTLYQDTVQKSPDFDPAKTELVRALYAKNRVEEAEELSLVLRADETQSSSLNRAAALVRQGKYDEARAFLLEEIKKHNAQERPALEMVMKITIEMVGKTDDVKLQHQYFQDVVGWMNRVMQLSNDPFNWYRLGRIHLWLGDREQARVCFSQAARLMPQGSIYIESAQKLVKDLSE